jgi:(1->4)-alpha-D-glucan 1-alpha-D-glucosylmutase
VVEKILEAGEQLRPWPVAGTTGYDFIRRADSLQVATQAEDAMTRAYTTFTGRQAAFAEVAREGKVLVMQDILGSELNRVTALALRVCERHRRHRDHTRHDLHEALRETAASFPIYRTYVRAEAGEIAPEDVTALETAVNDARDRRPDLAPDLFEFLGDLMALRVTGDLESELVMRFQQLTGAVMAKGVEDTAFYRYARLISLNEVGGDPGIFGGTPDSFHAENAAVLRAWPTAMLAGSTHDTKRSEDARARISVLSEMPTDWESAVHRWAFMNEAHRSGDAPDRNTEYLLYQTLVGAWPIDLERLQAVMQKSVREQKERTAWTRPDDAYEAALTTFVERVHGSAEFRADLEAFLQRLIPAARQSSLATVLLRLTSPGVPDVYQGAELWDERLVDPDNRRPVDYERRRRLLAEVDGLTVDEVLSRSTEGLPKLYLLRRALEVRRRHVDAFGPDGGYRPLEAGGEKAAHLVSFLRGEQVLTVVPRLCLTLGEDWGDTAIELPDGRWCDAFTGQPWDAGEPVLVSRLLGRFPVAMLEREAAAG